MKNYREEVLYPAEQANEVIDRLMGEKTALIGAVQELQQTIIQISKEKK